MVPSDDDDQQELELAEVETQARRIDNKRKRLDEPKKPEERKKKEKKRKLRNWLTGGSYAPSKRKETILRNSGMDRWRTG